MSLAIVAIVILLILICSVCGPGDNTIRRKKYVLDEQKEAAICNMIIGIYKEALEAARKARQIEDFSTIGWSERCDLIRHMDYLINVHGKVFKDRTILEELEISHEELTELIEWLASKLYPENYAQDEQQALLPAAGSQA